MSNTALDEAVSTAVAEETKNSAEQQTEQKTEAVETKTVETKQPEIDQETQTALNLYRALSDPENGQAVLKLLAEKAGLLGEKENKTPRQVKRALTDALKETLGDYDFLADRLGPALEAHLEQMVSERVAPLQSALDELNVKQVNKEVDSSFSKFQEKHKDFKDYDKQMTDLSKKFPYTGEYPMEEYLESMYKLASSEARESKAVEKVVDRINRNAKEVRETSVEVPETKIVKGSKLPTLNEALAAAVRGERFS